MTKHLSARSIAALALAAALTAPAAAQALRTEPVVRGLQDAWALRRMVLCTREAPRDGSPLQALVRHLEVAGA